MSPISDQNAHRDHNSNPSASSSKQKEKLPWLKHFKIINPARSTMWTRWKKFIKASGPASEATIFQQINKPHTELSDKKNPPQTEAWQKTAKIASILAAVVGLLNLAFLIWMVLARDNLGAGGIHNLMTSSCSTVKALDKGLHFAINILSTVLLGASNYTMQCLVAPTRKELDKAHEKGEWLHIGRLSVRNILHMRKSKLSLWLLLTVSSLPLHLLYNSAVFASLQANEYLAVAVNEGFMRGESWPCTESWQDKICEEYYASTLKQIQADAIAGKLERLENAECIKAYSSPFISNRKHVVLVSNITTVMNDTGHVVDTPILGVAFSSPYKTDSDYTLSLIPKNGSYFISTENLTMVGMAWICPPKINNNILCTYSIASAAADNWNVLHGGFPIQYCLSQPIEVESCGLQGSSTIMIVICCFNFVKALCILLSVKFSKTPVMATVGDAVASYLDRHDDFTTFSGKLAKKAALPQSSKKSMIVQLKRHVHQLCWFNSVSISQWATCLLLCFISLCTACYGLWRGYTTVGDSSFLTSRFGEPNLSEQWNRGGKVPTELISIVLLVNMPQVIVSVLYLLYNGVYTSMLLAREWSLFAGAPRTLRVSQPKGEQRMNYWLSVPYRYGLPLSLSMVILHWLISQSIFLIDVSVYDIHGVYKPLEAINTHPLMGGSDIFRAGYSISAILIAIIYGSVMLVVLVAISFRHMDSRMPPANGNSRIISEACHPPRDASDPTIPVQWGEIEEERGLNGEVERRPIHFSIASGKVHPIHDDFIYS